MTGVRCQESYWKVIVYMYVCVRMYVCICMYVCMGICVCMSMCVYMYVCVHHKRMYGCIDIDVMVCAQSSVHGLARYDSR